jgi:roadblock/LC7 domain-containing protein
MSRRNYAYQVKPIFVRAIMSRTSELLKLPGVVAAGLFSRKGFLEESEGALTEAEAAEMVSLCTAITMTMEMQGRLLGRLADSPGWTSCYGWMTWGPEMSIVTIHDSMCIVRGRQASFNQMVKAMTESAHTEPIKPGGKGEPNANLG